MAAGHDPASPALIRVLIVDDHPVTRDGIRAALERTGSCVVVGDAGDAESALRLLATLAPDVVLVDLRLDGGPDGRTVIRRAAGAARVLVLSQARTDEVLAAIREGAHGYVPKGATGAELAAAVHAVRDGPVLPPELAARLLTPDAARLTARERDVLRCLAKGYDNREIAQELGVAVRTVNRHLENIRAKVGRHRRSELLRFARNHD